MQKEPQGPEPQAVTASGICWTLINIIAVILSCLGGIPGCPPPHIYICKAIFCGSFALF